MQCRELRLSGAKLLVPPRHGDPRGWFTELYSVRNFEKFGIDAAFVQDNMSFSAARSTIRGLHMQREPYSQAKLVAVLRGRIYDAIVDCRPGSPTLGRFEAVELSAEGGEMLFVPRGFCHGFLTLVPDTQVLYKVDNVYNKESEGGIVWNDPDLAIPWPLDGTAPVLSDKDGVLPRFRDLVSEAAGPRVS